LAYIALIVNICARGIKTVREGLEASGIKESTHDRVTKALRLNIAILCEAFNVGLKSLVKVIFSCSFSF